MVKFLRELSCHFRVCCQKQVVVLLESVSAGIPSACCTLPGRRPIGRPCPQDFSVDDIRLQVHDIASSIPFDPDLDSWLSRQLFALVAMVVDLCPVPVDPDSDPFSCFFEKNSRKISVGKGIHGDVDRFFGFFKNCNIDFFKILCRGVVFSHFGRSVQKGSGKGRADGFWREKKEREQRESHPWESFRPDPLSCFLPGAMMNGYTWLWNDFFLYGGMHEYSCQVSGVWSVEQC